MAKTEPLPLFYSLNRFIDHEACISAGSVEICRASFTLNVVGEEAAGIAVKLPVKGKLDTCGSVSLSHSSYLQDGFKDCRKHGLKEVVLSGIGGQSKPLREAGVLHVKAAGEKVKKILCYKFDQRVGNT